MKISFFISVFIVNSLLLQGCTNTLYKGEIETIDAENNSRKVILYWSKTETFLTKDKAGPAILMTECSTRSLTFVEKESGIYFFGTPGMDQFANQQVVISQHEPCGEIINSDRFINLQAGSVNVMIHCQAVFDEFSVNTAHYINAREQPYTFEIKKSSQWSMFGEMLKAPSMPVCRE